MPTIQSLGLSGLPLDSLLTSLRNNENQALVVIQGRQANAQARLSAYGKLRDALASFQKAAQTAGSADAFSAIAVRNTSTAFSATADTTAIPGQYAVQIDRVASAQTLAYAGRADRTSSIGTGGLLSITLGNGEVHTLDLTGSDPSLDKLVAAINADPNIGVNATLVNDGSQTPWRLMLTSRETGTQAAAVQVAVANNPDLATFLAYDATSPDPAITVQAAQDASLQINGISITSQSNTVTNVIQGVTLTLSQTTSGPVTLGLARDDAAAKKAIEDFVKTYNSLLSTIGSLTSYDVASQSAAALTGDSTARMVQTRMRDALAGAAAGAGGTTLATIGITTDPKTGMLQIDDTALDKALSGGAVDVSGLFTGSTGIGARVSQAADTFTRSGGIFATATDGLNRTIAGLDDQYASMSARIDQRMETYRTQFTQLDAMVSQMNSLSSYLSQQLSSLSTPQKQK